MGSDASFSYIHFPTQESVLFVEAWESQKLRWNDVDLPNAEDIDQHSNLLEQFLMQSNEEEPDFSFDPANNPIMNSSYANRVKQRSKTLNWKDVDIDSFQTHAKIKKRGNRKNVIVDETILRKPNFGALSGDADLDAAMRLGDLPTSTTIESGIMEDIGELNQSSSNWDIDQDMRNEFNSSNDNAFGHSRNILNPDVSRSFTQQFTTPVVGNRVYMPNFQGSASRAVSQQRRQPSDNNNRNTSYHSPRRDNIR